MHNFPTMITPYKADGSLDLETAKKYVKFYYENGCDGVFAVCQSSEIAYLSVEERVLLNKTVYDYAKSLDNNFIVVSSGHVANTIEAQADELNKIASSGTDALIFITNRLDICPSSSLAQQGVVALSKNLRNFHNVITFLSN